MSEILYQLFRYLFKTQKMSATVMNTYLKKTARVIFTENSWNKILIFLCAVEIGQFG